MGAHVHQQTKGSRRTISGKVLDLVEVLSVRQVFVLADLPLLKAAPEHDRPPDLLARGLQGALDCLAVALLLQGKTNTVFEMICRGGCQLVVVCLSQRRQFFARRASQKDESCTQIM